mmetsp:Transcript_20940/g.64440  ORF Transcript_20940/g.64440 Transcript_20940/m.64440 type:complete len:550 (-) Transcript_20940:18-1667(-)
MRRALLLAVLVASGIGAGRAADPRTSLADDAGSIGAGRAVEEADLIYEDADDAFDEDYGQDDDDDYAYAGEYGSDGYFGFSEYDGDGSYDDDYGRERDDEAVTKLRHAIEEGNVDVVGSLLENGADLEKKFVCRPMDVLMEKQFICLPSCRFTPLHLAAQEGRAKVVELLLAKGADTEAKEPKTLATPLHYAARKNHPDAVRALVAGGADREAVMVWAEGATPLWVAMDNRAFMAANALIEVGCDPNLARYDDNWTALHYAVMFNNTGLVAKLIDYGAGIDARVASSNATPLMIACEDSLLGPVKQLLSAGADPNIARSDGSTPLISACEQNSSEIADILLAAGADPNHLRKWNALYTSTAQGNAYLVKSLLLRGASVDAIDSNNYTALTFAIVRENIEIAKILLAAGADPNWRDMVGEVPLHQASDSGFSVEIVELLLASGADCDAATGSGSFFNPGVTPLMIAAMRGHRAISKLLLDAGARTNVTSSNGKTVFDDDNVGIYTLLSERPVVYVVHFDSWQGRLLLLCFGLSLLVALSCCRLVWKLKAD